MLPTQVTSTFQCRRLQGRRSSRYGTSVWKGRILPNIYRGELTLDVKQA